MKGKTNKNMLILLFLLYPMAACIHGMFDKKHPVESKFEGKIFCRNRSHLIRLEKVGDIFLVETEIESAILLQCKFCDEQDSRTPRIWYRQNQTTGEIKELELVLSGKKPRVRETHLHSLVNYNVSMQDIGLYYCKLPYEDSFSSGFNYLIEILDGKAKPVNGTLQEWKNYSDEYLLPVNNELQKQFTAVGTDVKVYFEVFSSWGDWTPCETCVKEPHQYQTAHCRIRAVCLQEICSRALAHGEAKGEVGIVRILLNTSTSLPCSGQLLPRYLPQVATLLRSIPDFKHNQSCGYACPFFGTSSDNSEKKLLTFEEGENAVIPCPGQQGLTKVWWEFNKRKIDPKVWNKPDGHILIDHFGVLHLREVTRDVKGTYKCYSRELPILEVKIRVHRKSKMFGKGFLRHLKYLLSVILLCFIVFIQMILIAFCRTKLRANKKKVHIARDMEEGLQPLLIVNGTDGRYSSDSEEDSYFDDEEDNSTIDEEDFLVNEIVKKKSVVQSLN